MKKLLIGSASALFAATLLFGLDACSEEDIGVPCEIPETEGIEEPGVLFNFQALECRSRICMKGAGVSAHHRCTRVCESDDDCPSDGIGTCGSAFKCRYGKIVGRIGCCKVCICGDDVGPTDPLEATCLSSPANENCPTF